MSNQTFVFKLSSAEGDTVSLRGEIEISFDGADAVASYSDGPNRKWEGRAELVHAAILQMLACRLACENAMKKATCRRLLSESEES